MNFTEMASLIPDWIPTHFFHQPILNLSLQHSHRHIPIQIAASKSFLVTSSLQAQGATPRALVPFFIFLVLVFILPNYKALLNPVLEFGVVFTFSYIQCLSIMHGRTSFVVYDLLLFFTFVLSVEFEVVFDIFIIISMVYELKDLKSWTEIGMSCVQLVYSFAAFLVLWWMNYLFIVYYVLTELIIAYHEFCPRLFTNSLFFVIFYRLLGSGYLYF